MGVGGQQHETLRAVFKPLHEPAQGIRSALLWGDRRAPARIVRLIERHQKSRGSASSGRTSARPISRVNMGKSQSPLAVR